MISGSGARAHARFDQGDSVQGAAARWHELFPFVGELIEVVDEDDFGTWRGHARDRFAEGDNR